MRRILNCLEFGRDYKSYDEDVRTFCLTLHYYSPRAYNYVREKFENNLPSITTIRNWYASLNASPGFTSESFETLKKKAEESESVLLGALIFDEMSIRTHLQWDAAQLMFQGNISLGRKYVGQNIVPVAKDALVFLVSGMNADFKIPIGYFFTNGLNACEKAALLNEALIRLANAKVEIVSITFDGFKTNVSMCNVMGANFKEGKGYIIDPVDFVRRIYVFMDPPHMLKLARNHFGSKIIIDGEGNKIEWKYVELLHQTQNKLPSNLDNKLTKEHMQWASKKMNVRLAAQTLSSSVADALEFLKDECEDFEGVDGTIKYIRIINDIFDIMNSTTSGKEVGFKKPLSMSTYGEYFDKLDEALDYLPKLQFEGSFAYFRCSGPFIFSKITSSLSFIITLKMFVLVLLLFIFGDFWFTFR